MIITLTGIACIILAFSLFLKEGKKALLDPRLIILVYYFSFWGRIFNLDFNLYNDLLLFCSFLIFYGIVDFIYHQKLEFSRKLVSMLPLDAQKNSGPLSRKTTFFIFSFVIACIAITLVYYAGIFESLEAALVRFYSRLPEKETKSVYETCLVLMYLASVLGVTMIHYSNRKFGKIDTPLFYACCFGLVLISFSSGSRGHILFPAVLIFISEIFISIKEKQSLFKIFTRPLYVALLLISLILALFLTENRNRYYDNTGEVLTELLEGQYLFAEQDDQNSGIDGEKDLMMSDYYLTLEMFPKEVEYLPLYSSLYTVMVNPIPRFLWAGKPAGFGRKLAALKLNWDHNDDEVIATDLHTSYAVGIHGEGYAHGGIGAMFFYTVLLGIISGIIANIYKELFQYDSFLTFILCLAFLATPSCCIRGDILAGFSQFIFPGIGLFVCLIVFKKIFIGKTSEPVVPERENQP